MLVMKPYSEDLRIRIVAAVEDGMPKTEAARLFDTSLSSVKRYCGLAARGEPLAPRKGGGRPPKADAAIASLLEGDVGRRPYASVRERAAYLGGVSGIELSVSTVRRLMRKLGFSQKTEPGCEREGRVPEVGLEGRGFGESGSLSLRVRGRDGLQHLPLAALRLVEGGRALARQGTA